MLVASIAFAYAETPPEAVAHYDAGLTAKHAKQYDTAALELKRAIELDMDYIDAHWVLAWVYVAQQKTAGAAEHFGHVVRIAPDTEKAREAAAALQRIGKPVSGLPQPAQARSQDDAPSFIPLTPNPDLQMYVTWNPDIYHRFDCRAAQGPQTPMLKSAAIAQGIPPCELCKPDQLQCPPLATWDRAHHPVSQTQTTTIARPRTAASTPIRSTGGGKCRQGGAHVPGKVDRNGRTHCAKCGQFM